MAALHVALRTDGHILWALHRSHRSKMRVSFRTAQSRLYWLKCSLSKGFWNGGRVTSQFKKKKKNLLCCTCKRPCQIAFVYKCKSYYRGGRLPWPGGVMHTAWLRADRTLCSARPILSFPAKDLSRKITQAAHSNTATHTGWWSHHQAFVFAPASADVCARVCHTHPRRACDVCEKGVILPDDVSSLGEATRHKEAFDDVDFLIHGLRQVGGEIAIPRRGAWGDRMQKSKTKVTSQHKLKH